MAAAVADVADVQHERDGLALGDVELGADVAAVGLQRHTGEQRQLELVGREHDAVAVASRSVLAARVVKARLQPAAQPHAAAHTGDPADDPLVLGDGHQVLEFDDPVGRHEPCHQHVGVREIELRGPRLAVLRSDLPAAAALLVEDRGEHARRVEAGRAEPVDRAVGGDQRGRAQVADQPVRRDRTRGGSVGFGHRDSATRPVVATLSFAERSRGQPEGMSNRQLNSRTR